MITGTFFWRLLKTFVALGKGKKSEKKGAM